MIDNNTRRKPLFEATMLAFFLALLPLHAQGQPAAENKPATSRKTAAVTHTGKHMINPAYDYILNVDSNPYAYTVRVNDWLLSSSAGTANNHFSSTRLGDYLVQGKNTVSIHIGPPPKGVPPQDKFDLQVQTVRGAVLSYLWNPAKPHAPIPVQAEAHFDVSHLPLGPWAWQTAPKITLDAPTKAAINAHIKHLFDALNTKSVNKATALFATSNREGSAITGYSTAESDAVSHADWTEEFSDPHWRMDPIDYAHLRYTLEADGRAVLVQRADGGDVLRTTTVDKDGLLTSYDINLSLVHGRWTLVR